jgi:sialate O-acetylesterase
MERHLGSCFHALVVLIGIHGGTALANVKLPAILSDNMVLQQGKPAGVWGWASPGEKVTVRFAGKSAETVAGADGKWGVKVEGLPPGTAGEMTVAGENTLTIKNVVVGEVWLASGQSNMAFQVANSRDAAQEIEAANFPMLRMYTVDEAASTEPAEDTAGRWEVCTPENVPHFSAVGYFFARRLSQTLQEPIGIIHSSLGGTPAEFWTPTAVLAANPVFKRVFDSWERAVADYPQAKEKYDLDLAAWREAAKARAPGTEAPLPPAEPVGRGAFGSPGGLYNGMIAPLTHFTIGGVIWYQGEANARNGEFYGKLFPTLIRSWRQAWGNDDLPFLYVQLASFMERHAEPADTRWARLREAQLQTLEVPHTGMAVTIDIGDPKDVHPKNKQDVGKRLALWAEATVYSRDEEYSGPLPGGMQIAENKARITFRHGHGMKAADGGKVKGFAIAGSDRKFVWAEAEIQGEDVVVSSPEVAKPVAVRYAWDDDPECNLVNSAGLPASPFRTDQWPIVAAK